MSLADRIEDRPMEPSEPPMVRKLNFEGQLIKESSLGKGAHRQRGFFSGRVMACSRRNHVDGDSDNNG